jgi:hypothetical protein
MATIESALSAATTVERSGLGRPARLATVRSRMTEARTAVRRRDAISEQQRNFRLPDGAQRRER